MSGEKSDIFRLEQVVAQSCSLFPVLFFMLVNDPLVEVQEAGFGVQLNSGKCNEGILFADDFVGISDSSKTYRSLLMWCVNTVTGEVVGKCWQVCCNGVSKTSIGGNWMWSEHSIPQVSNYEWKEENQSAL